MQRVDLSLAVNYVPACACLCKVLLLMLLIGMVPPGEEVRGGFIPLAAMLYVDRVLTRNIIFDANAILLAVFFANTHATVRATSPKHTYWFFEWGLHACWITMCLILIHEPKQVQWWLEKRVQASKAVPMFLMILVLVGTAYRHHELEAPPLRACRAMAFTLLSFTWIYVVGIHSQSGIEYLKETSSQFIVRLAPVLYSPLWMAAAFTVAAVVALVLQYSRRFSGQHGTAEGNQLTQVVTIPQPAAEQAQFQPIRASETTEDIQLHELFRQAKSRSSSAVTGSGVVYLETVPE